MRPLLLAVGLCACGSGTGSFQGDVAGYALDVKEAIYLDLAGPSGTQATVLLSDETGTCQHIQAHQRVHDATTLVATLGKVGQGNTLEYATTGTYGVDQAAARPGDLLAVVELDVADATCQTILVSRAIAGTVDVTSISRGSSIAGSFDLKLAGGSGKGTFDAVFCAATVEDYQAPASCL